MPPPVDAGSMAPDASPEDGGTLPPDSPVDAETMTPDSSADAGPTPMGSSRAPCPAGDGPCTEMYFVAHYDDDLYFMNPDIQTSLRNGNDVVVTYMTGAGGNAGELYWTNRERGILDAYDQMTDPAKNWKYTKLAFGTQNSAISKDVAVFTHDLAKVYPGRHVTLIFMRLADTQLETLWSGTGDRNQPMPDYRIDRLACGVDDPKNCALGSVMKQDSYSRAELLFVLVEMMKRYKPASINTLDATGLNFSAFTDPHAAPFTENGSHVGVGMFALAAAQRYQSLSSTTDSVFLRFYRGYSMGQEAENLSNEERDEKCRIASYYDAWDCVVEEPGKPTHACWAPDATPTRAPQAKWCEHVGAFYADTRMYSTRSLLGAAPLQGRIALGTSLSAPVCLGVNSAGTAAVGATCNGAPQWIITKLNQIQLAGTSNCLKADPSSAQILLAPCSGAASEPARDWMTFFVLSNGQIRARERGDAERLPSLFPPNPSGSCLTASAVDANVTYGFCQKNCINQATGKLDPQCGSDNRSCSTVDEVDGAGCNGAGASGASSQACLPGLIGEADLHCFATPAGTPIDSQDWTLVFGAPQLVSSDFSNATEVGSASTYYRTFAIGKNNVCVRRADGVWCAAGSVGADGSIALEPATQLTKWFPDTDGWDPDANGSTVRAFWDEHSQHMIACGRGYYKVACDNGLYRDSYTNDDGWAVASFRYGSVRYVDVTGDGSFDICGRGVGGITCAINHGTEFSPPDLWTSDFSEQSGWNLSGCGDTMMYADLDGDGATDVCGRGAGGLECSLGRRTHFASHHDWSFDSDRRFPARALEFGDSDVSVFPGSSARWNTSSAYYGSMHLIDINRDGLADVCGRSSTGTHCALSMGNRFERMHQVVLQTEDLTDGTGWANESNGSTLTFGDVNGDSRVDMCARGNAGILCASGY